MRIQKAILAVAFLSWLFGCSRHDPVSTVDGRIEVRIVDVLDSDEADRGFTKPLEQALLASGVGQLASVCQGAAETPDEFTRIIQFDVTDYPSALTVVQETLAQLDAPSGSLMIGRHGGQEDIFILGPDREDGR